jgi:hypothetical protein
VNILVTAIDGDYGFTNITIVDRFSGHKLKFLTICEENGKVIIENTLTHTEIHLEAEPEQR